MTTTFAKSWNSCSDTGSSPMPVITWEQHTILMALKKVIIIIFLTCCQKVNWYLHLSKFIHGELAVFIPGWNKDERWIVRLSNTTPCIGKYEVAKKCLLIKLLECFQELLLALTWPPFQAQSDHLEKMQWTWSLRLIFNSVSGVTTILLWQIRWTQVNRSFYHQTPPSPSSRSRLLWNTILSTYHE